MGGGQTRDIQRRELSLSESQEARAGRAEALQKQLFDLTFPGMQTAESHYQTLASGDPAAIQREIAPATERINMASQAAQEQIRNEMPRGGTQQLAIEEAGIARAGQVGNLATQAYTSSFPALAALGGQGIGLSINELSNAIASSQSAGQTMGAAGQQAAQGKSSTMGLFGSLLEGAGRAGAAGVAKCWIAEALYGVHDYRTFILRIWLNQVYGKTRLGALLMCAYGLFGRRIARLVQRFPLARYLFKPLFDRALERARDWQANIQMEIG